MYRELKQADDQFSQYQTPVHLPTATRDQPSATENLFIWKFINNEDHDDLMVVKHNSGIQFYYQEQAETLQ